MDNKPKRRHIAHSQESLELMRANKKDSMQDTLERVGYRKEEEYRDTINEHYKSYTQPFTQAEIMVTTTATCLWYNK